jgi:peptidoglycan/LPS O-acetylase OafA/YrhL
VHATQGKNNFMTTLAQNEKYRPALDGLRGIAILLVLLYHAKLDLFDGGFLGVDIFFVISGYLITAHLQSEILTTGRLSLSGFYAKRIKRLLPSVFVLLTVALAVWTFLFLDKPEETFKFFESVKYSSLGLANVFFQRNASRVFFAISDRVPLLHFWSLAIEEQFYLIWPLVMIFCAGLFKTKKINAGLFRRRLSIVLIFIVMGSFLSSLYMTAIAHEEIAFFWMPARAWELGLGALLVVFQNKLSSRFTEANADKWIAAGLTLIFVSIFFLARKLPYPALGAILPTLGAAFCICGQQVSLSSRLTRLLSWPPLVKVGVLSFGLYLWHWPIITMFRIYQNNVVLSAPIMTLAIALSFVAAALNLKFIENPGRYKLFKNKKPWQPILWGCLSMGFVVLATVVIQLNLMK